MGESGRRKGKEPVEDSYVPMRPEATNESTASCSYPTPEKQEEQRAEKNSRQLILKRRREEPLKPPPGFHFRPTDHELVFKYLYRKKMYNSVPYDCIREANVYAAHPREITEAFMKWGAEGKWYFFTSRERKYPLGERPSRRTIDYTGYWKATGTDKKMRDDSIPHVTGVKKTLVFYEGRDSGDAKTNWTMYEYTTEDDRDAKGKEEKKKLRIEKAKKYGKTPTDMKLDDCVLCTIQRQRGASKEDENEDRASNAESSQSSSPPRGEGMMMMNPEDAQIVLAGNRANDHQIVLSGIAEHNVIDANASNQQIVLTGEEHIGFRPEDQFSTYIDSGTATPEEDIENQLFCFNSEEQNLSAWDSMESLSPNAGGDLYSIVPPALPASEEELEVADDRYKHELSMSTPPDSYPEGELHAPK